MPTSIATRVSGEAVSHRSCLESRGQTRVVRFDARPDHSHSPNSAGQRPRRRRGSIPPRLRQSHPRRLPARPDRLLRVLYIDQHRPSSPCRCLRTQAWGAGPAVPGDRGPKLWTISGFFKYAVNEEVIGKEPCRTRRPKVGSDSVSTGLDRGESSALVAAARADGTRTHALVLLLGLNGPRVSEALGAQVTDLDTEHGHRVLRITRKGGKTATVALVSRTAAQGSTRTSTAESTVRCFRRAASRWTRAAVWRTLRRRARIAVPKKGGSLHPHYCLRHAFVTLSLDVGASLRDVQDAAGHADPRTTRRYDHARHNLDKHPTYALAGLVD